MNGRGESASAEASASAAPRPITRRGPVWSGVFVALLLSLLVVAMSQRQRSVTREITETVEAMRSGRVDLAEGFAHAMLGEFGEVAFDRDRGEMLLRQAVRDLQELVARIPDTSIDSEAFDADLLRLKHALDAWTESRGTSAAVLLRIAFAQLDERARAVDEALARHLEQIDERMERELLWVIVLSTLAIGGILAALFVLERRREAAERLRAAAEGEVEAARRNYEQIAQGLPQMVWTCDSSGSCDFLSRRWEQFTGVPVSDQLGHGWLACIHPDDRESLRHAWLGCVRTGRAFRHDARMRSADGEYRWFDMRALPLSGDDGTVVRWFGSSTDVHEQWLMRARLQRERERFTAFCRTVPGVMFTANRTETGVWQAPFVTAALETLTGLRPEEIEADTEMFFAAIDAADRPAVMESIARAVEAGNEWRCEFTLHHPRLGPRRLLAHAVREQTAEATEVWHGIGTDVTDQRRGAAALVESEARFRQLVENIDEVFWIFDQKLQQVVYVSPNFVKVWGQPPAAVFGDRRSYLAAVHEADRDRVRNAMEQRSRNEGSDEIYRIVRPDGASRWIHERAFLVRDEHGILSRIVGVVEDVTRQKELESNLLRTQRMEAVGALAGGIAHDLNNILVPMLMVSGMLRGSLAEERDRELIDLVESGAKRGAEIVRQLLAFSRGMDGQRLPLEAKHLVGEVIGLVRETFPRDIVVRNHVGPGLWPVVCDATQIHQVLMNLCVNARDAMPDGGVLEVKAFNQMLSEPEATARHGCAAGPYLCIEVTDTGCGISPETMPRIFDPFFTTKPPGKGTGLGLSTVSGIVRGHGGFVSVESTPATGTRFTFGLPAQPNECPEAPVACPASVGKGRGERILVVDDEGPVRETFRHLLETAGYRVTSAADGAEALELWASPERTFDLVVTDMMMPAMGGLNMLRVLRRTAPDVPVVAMTGLAQAGVREELDALGVVEYLEKPTQPADVLLAVRRALGGAEAIDAGLEHVSEKS
jgi:PAS domain S-box-containing protein